jgi:hypothetical protein
MSLDIKIKKANIVVKNDGTPDDLLKNTLSKLNKYLDDKK